MKHGARKKAKAGGLLDRCQRTDDKRFDQTIVEQHATNDGADEGYGDAAEAALPRRNPAAAIRQAIAAVGTIARLLRWLWSCRLPRKPKKVAG